MADKGIDFPVSRLLVAERIGNLNSQPGVGNYEIYFYILIVIKECFSILFIEMDSYNIFK